MSVLLRKKVGDDYVSTRLWGDGINVSALKIVTALVKQGYELQEEEE